MTLTNTKLLSKEKNWRTYYSKDEPFSMKIYMDVLYENTTHEMASECAYVIRSFAKHQKEVVKFNLPNMILSLTWHLMSKETQEQTRVCFNELCGVIDNVDIIKII